VHDFASWGAAILSSTSQGDRYGCAIFSPEKSGILFNLAKNLLPASKNVQTSIRTKHLGPVKIHTTFCRRPEFNLKLIKIILCLVLT
jgi:hypothetical protein